ncbi:hypothetical protein [Enterococcus faecalis]|uniref:hypothetical protein n=1 Tax=Enterococcus faecalis TaxID=1351 RepID=UPI0003541DBC|nr:hypothetical protein [Enterococcus faecalis]EPI40048.1 hypothetical protein D347_00531 [Enterococcus faecalis LA3B-2]
MRTTLSLLFVIGCVGVWYFIKKDPDTKRRNISIVVTILSIFLISIIPNTSFKEETHTKVQDTSQLKKAEKKKDFKVKLKLDATELEADKDGKVVIKGNTNPEATVSIGMGIIGDSTKADKDGNFSLDYVLKDDSKIITINSNLEGNNTSEKISIKQNPKVIEENKASQEKERAEKEKEKEQDTSDITIMKDKPTIEQENVLQELAQQRFDQQYPYKGSKMHIITGVLQPWIKNGESWFYKVNATIVNAFGAERNANVEITIQPVSATSGNVTIIDY